jgi:hypothetical protein
VVGALGISGTGVMADLPLIVAFVILAAFTYSSGLRAPASIAIVKDILIYITAFAAVIVIPVQLGGFERFLPVGRIVVDEFAVDVARVEIGGGDRHDCACGYRDGHGGQPDADLSARARRLYVPRLHRALHGDPQSSRCNRVDAGIQRNASAAGASGCYQHGRLSRLKK